MDGKDHAIMEMDMSQQSIVVKICSLKPDQVEQKPVIYLFIYWLIDWLIYLGKCFLFNWKESVVFSISAKRLSWVKCFRHSTLAHLQHIHHRIPNCALKGIIDMNVKPLHRFPWNDQGYWCWLFKLQEWQSAKFICENTQKSSSDGVTQQTSGWMHI